MKLYLVHHGDAVGPAVDPRRPLSSQGVTVAARLAADAASRGAAPAAIWHSGKLRAKQTAEAFWRGCSPFAALVATRDLQPDDPPMWIRDRLAGETHDVMIVGHFPHLPRLLALLLGEHRDAPGPFPLHGVVALESDDEGISWREMWRLEGS